VKLRFRPAVAGILALGVFGTLAVTAVEARAATVKPAIVPLNTYWQDDGGTGAVVTTNMPASHLVTVDGNSFAASSPGPNSFAAYLAAGTGQWIYGPNKAYVPSGYPDPAVPSTSGLTKVWSGTVDGYPVTLYTNSKNPNSAASTLQGWLAS